MNHSLRILITLSIFIIFCYSNSYSQANNDTFHWIAEYKFSFKPNKDQKKHYSEYMLLMFNDEKSGFRSVSNAILDSLDRSESYKKLSMNERLSISSKYPSRVDEYITIKPSNNTVTFTTIARISSPAIHPQYIEEININWKLIDEKRIINGVNCLKATTSLFGRTWTAWYSLEHPTPYGPYKFFGLPGLIFLIEDNSGSYKYEISKIRKKTTVYPTNIFNNIKKLPKTEAIKYYKQGRYSMAYFSSMKIVDGPKDIQKRMENKLKELEKFENNPIELQINP